MAGKLIVDTLQTESPFLQLNVSTTRIATMNASGIFSNTGTKMIGTDGTIGVATFSGSALIANTVTGDKLGQSAVSSNNIVNATITGDKIADNSITSAKLNTSIFATTPNIFGVTANSNTFSNTIIIVAGNTAPINVGMLVSGSNVAPGTTVLSFNSNPPSGRSNITLSAATVGTNTNTAFSFYESDKVLSPGIAGPGLCKAWVNFNGTGAVQIRAAYNVSSITDGGTGSYEVNFTTAMPDANYSAVASGRTFTTVVAGGANITTTKVAVSCLDDNNLGNDITHCFVAVFR